MGKYKRVRGVNCGFNKGKKFTKQWLKNLSNAHLGQIAWNKGKRIEKISGENNYQWKGEMASKSAKHTWVVKHKGRPKICEHCKTTKNKVYDWANKDHKYRRILSDYIRLCRKCHRNYDYKNHLCNIGSKYGPINNKF